MRALLSLVLSLFSLLLFARAILSWIPNKSGALASLDDFVFTVTEPVLAPVRRVIPPVGGFDISFLVVILGIMIVRSVLRV
jgi:YggT family protein